MGSLIKSNQEAVDFVEKRSSLSTGNTLIKETSAIKYNNVESEFKELNSALNQAKDKLQLVPQPKTKMGKWVMDKWPKFGIWYLEKIKGQEFANADSLQRVEILLEQLDQTFLKLQQNIEPTKKLQQSIITRIEEFQKEYDRIDDFLLENPDTESKDFLKMHNEKLKATIEVLQNTALVWLNDNIANRLKMFATAMSERKQLEVTLVAGINTLRTTQEVKNAAESHQGMRDLTNSLQQMAAKANTDTNILVADTISKNIFTLETMKKIQEENERSQKLVAETKRLNEKENLEMKAFLDSYEPSKLDHLSKDGAELLNANTTTSNE